MPRLAGGVWENSTRAQQKRDVRTVVCCGEGAANVLSFAIPDLAAPICAAREKFLMVGGAEEHVAGETGEEDCGGGPGRKMHRVSSEILRLKGVDRGKPYYRAPG